MIKDFDKITNEEIENISIKKNYHTHNYLCTHAEGTVEDYVAEAVKNGYTEIGITDHAITKFNDNGIYLNLEKTIKEYLPQFTIAQEKYGEKISIKKGLEIEFFEGIDNYYSELLKYVDYLILGQHQFMYNNQLKNTFRDGITEQNFIEYFYTLEQGLDSGFFKFVAHPDAIFFKDFITTEKIINAFDAFIKHAVKKDIPLELNANGIRHNGGHYPTDIFIELLKRNNAKVIVSSDCHKPEFLADIYVKKLYAYALKQGLNLLT